MKRLVSIVLSCMLLMTMGGAVAEAKKSPERQAYLSAIAEAKRICENHTAVISSLKKQNNGCVKANVILKKAVKKRDLGEETRAQLQELNGQISAVRVTVLEVQVQKMQLKQSNRQNAAAFNAEAANEVYKNLAELQNQQISHLEAIQKNLMAISELYKAANA